MTNKIYLLKDEFTLDAIGSELPFWQINGSSKFLYELRQWCYGRTIDDNLLYAIKNRLINFLGECVEKGAIIGYRDVYVNYDPCDNDVYISANGLINN